MSTTTPEPITAEADGHQQTRPPTRSAVARFAGPVALVLGALLAAAGMGLHLPAMAEESDIPLAIAAAPGRWIAAHLLMGFGFALVAVGAGIALTLVRRDRGGTLTAMGAITTVLGAITMALGDAAHGAVGLALTEVDTATSLAVHEAFFAQPAILGINTGPLLLPIGMLVLGAGLLRSRLHPRWVGIVVMLSPIGVQAAFALDLPTLVHGIPFAIGMSTFAYALVRASQPHQVQETP